MLFEQISGTPAHLAPFGAGTDTPTFRRRMTAFPTTLTPNLANGLHMTAAAFLARHGVSDEPVTWSPPLELLDGLELPGTDIRQIDTDRLHRLVRTDWAGTATAGQQLGVSSFTVHTLLLHHPAPRSTPDHATRQTARQILTPQVLTRYYHDEHLPLAHIDRRVGFARGTAHRLASEYGIPTRGSSNGVQRAHPALPRDWLYDQYLNHHRSLADLAREKQLGRSTLRYWAKIYQLPIQRRRPARMNIPAAAHAAPPLLRPAITGPQAWKRLHRFAEASRHATFGKAATALGIHTSALIDHINRLEREFGQPLLRRVEHRRTTQPTAFGREVVRAVRGAGRRGERGDR